MIQKLDAHRFLVTRSHKEGMLVEGMIYADDELMTAIERDQTLDQVANVATLPGLVGRSLAMPDAHQGYGFPIGGVAASDMAKGIVSAGGVGFDINCGVRLLSTHYLVETILPYIDPLLDELFRSIPAGTGRRALLGLNSKELDEVLRLGAKWAVHRGYGTEADLNHIEEHGRMAGADADAVSSRAKERGREQLGTLGSGNHFVEVQYVSDIYHEDTARTFGLEKHCVVVLIHTGSRGLGHQVCTDYLDSMQSAMKRYHIHVVDRQLACVPIASPEGEEYLRAMSAAANFAFANRQMITHWVRESFQKVTSRGELSLVYDVSHNIAKAETHIVNGEAREVLVHRKGATRAFPKRHPAIPEDYFYVGQPVLIPGSMGTSSYVLVGTEKAMEETFGSSCHGAGRAMSRTAAARNVSAEELIAQLRAKGVHVRGASKRGLAEERPEAYKDVSNVVDVVDQAGIAKKVARLIPIGVVKG